MIADLLGRKQVEVQSVATVQYRKDAVALVALSREIQDPRQREPATEEVTEMSREAEVAAFQRNAVRHRCTATVKRTDMATQRNHA